MIDKKLLLKLRKQTSLGMQVCKKALEEANGDFDKAIDILRKQGKKIAHKKLGREIEQGAILAKNNEEQTVGVLIGLGCETDFVAKNETFMQLCDYIADVALTYRPATKDELLACQGSKETVKDEIMNLMGVVGENIALAEYHLCEGPLVGSYVHTGNKLGAIVVLNQVGDSQAKLQAAKDMALQVVASDPLAIDAAGVSPTIIEKEQELVRKELAQDSKPEEVKQKIEQGRIKKFLERSTLLTQAFVKDESLNNQDYLKTIAPNFSVIKFKRASVAS